MILGAYRCNIVTSIWTGPHDHRDTWRTTARKPWAAVGATRES